MCSHLQCGKIQTFQDGLPVVCHVNVELKNILKNMLHLYAGFLHSIWMQLFLLIYIITLSLSLS